MRSGLGTFSDRRYSSSLLNISAQSLYLKHMERRLITKRVFGRRRCTPGCVVAQAGHPLAWRRQTQQHKRAFPMHCSDSPNVPPANFFCQVLLSDSRQWKRADEKDTMAGGVVSYETGKDGDCREAARGKSCARQQALKAQPAVHGRFRLHMTRDSSLKRIH